MIKLVRVDHRLLHGQVIFKWSRVLGIDCILIASDSVVKDDLRMSALRMAKPDGCKLVIKNIADSAEALNSGVTDKYKLLIITETINDVYRLSSLVPSIQYIDLGGTRMEEGKKQISKAIFVTEDDIRMLKEMNERGIKMEIQMVPDDSPENVTQFL